MNFSIYYLLGFINNYAGGFHKESGVFQSFSYLNSDYYVCPNKIEISERLILKCQQVLKYYNFEIDLIEEKWENGKGGTIYSKNLTEIIFNFCDKKDILFEDDYLELDEDIFDYIKNFRRFDDESITRSQIVQFLKGTFEGNAEDDVFYFWNGGSKCMFVHKVLKWFADEDDTLYLESHFRTPWVDKISYKKGGEITKLMKEINQ